MKKRIFVIIMLFASNIAYSQEKKSLFKIYSRNIGTGFDYIDFFSDSTFIQNGSVGLAKSIIDQGEFEQINDTIYFTLTFPRVINHIDTFTNPNHYDYRSDTLYMIDSISFCREKNCLTPDYKMVEKRYANGMLRKSYQWSTKEGVIKVGNVSHHLNDILIAHGMWVDYYPNGRVKRVVEYKNGLKSGIDVLFDEK